MLITTQITRIEPISEGLPRMKDSDEEFWQKDSVFFRSPVAATCFTGRSTARSVSTSNSRPTGVSWICIGISDLPGATMALPGDQELAP
jgi:hypothetical protein